MKTSSTIIDPTRFTTAWRGRVAGCMLGKPLEVLSFSDGRSGVLDYLGSADALPLRDYVSFKTNSLQDPVAERCCAGNFDRAEPDDDINYTVLALWGDGVFGAAELTTQQVAARTVRVAGKLSQEAAA
ncbi:MAG: hypothetical protein ACR2QL_14475 [Woeseiaceae bacterium]